MLPVTLMLRESFDLWKCHIRISAERKSRSLPAVASIALPVGQSLYDISGVSGVYIG
jgi:hypothetical protein